MITAVGQLNRPYIPDFDGADSFAGPSFHSAAWDHSVDLTGKRVALIGAGASGFQIARQSPTTSSISRCFSAARSGCSLIPCITSPSATGCAGRWIICRSIVAGIGFW
ncbi:flavin-binding monooxygenase-like family protein [Mycobacterium xenopi 4042]|uniref:Flavin-binding monooxygenase-like family protein n=1 Tax=Mycobacterium xenopi 4042 TaxID=1299334 RepID=X7YLF5_MYCXE|nr:flavin-binding monooxygenase-like family protein [Mycobacterium xenopi 4042]